jgi:hypothetical protein
MTRKTMSFPAPLLSFLLVIMMGTAYLCASSPAKAQGNQPTTAAGATQQPASEVTGTWSGTLFPKHANVAPFTLTVVINPDAQGNLIGASTLSSDCLKDARLQVTVTGSKVVLAGSDNDGDNIVVRGTVDKTGSVLKVNYILNGSATGRCETDDGTGKLAKR